MHRVRSHMIFAVVIAAAFGAGLGGCTSVYHKSMSHYGDAPPDLLARRVSEARDAQLQAAYECERAAAEAVAALRVAAERPAEARFRLERGHEAVDVRAWDMRKRIASIRDVAPAYFEPADDAAFSPPSRADRSSFERMMSAMERAEIAMLTALSSLHRRVEAAGAGAPDSAEVRAVLLAASERLELAAREADDFIARLPASPPGDTARASADPEP